MVKKSTKEKNAETVYKKILTHVETLVMKHNKVTYLEELNGVGKKLLGVKFKGVFASDNIPRLNNLTKYCILNLDRTDEPGSHWIALAKLPNGNSIMYDSFGRSSKTIIPSLWYSGNGRIIHDTRDAEQGIKESNCGQRTLAFLIFLDTYGPELAMLI